MSRAASCSGKKGSPALPKIDSTKSKLATRLPGTNILVSMVFLGNTFSTSGRTSGRSNKETHIFIDLSKALVMGKVIKSSGGCKAAANNFA